MIERWGTHKTLVRESNLFETEPIRESGRGVASAVWMVIELAGV